MYEIGIVLVIVVIVVIAIVYRDKWMPAEQVNKINMLQTYITTQADKIKESVKS